MDSVQTRAAARTVVALSMRERMPLAGASPLTPTQADLRAVRSEGRPWRSVATAADELRRLSDPNSLIELALAIVAPAPDLAWRLFHLAVLGELLHALRTSGARVVSLRPLGSSASGPAYLVEDADGDKWDLWFEAAGAWKYYEVPSPYAQLAAEVAGAGGPLGTDLMLMRQDRDRALLLECKYSWDASVVARGGYERPSLTQPRLSISPQHHGGDCWR